MMSRVMAAAAAVAAGVLLVGCSGSSLQTFGSPFPVVSAKPTATHSGPATRARKQPDLTFPSMRWDLVERGPLPAGCSALGEASLVLTGGAGAQAVGPRVVCRPPHSYWVRAVVKVAVSTPDGQWVYLTPVQPSPAALNRAPSIRSEVTACTPGELLEPVASFVLMGPGGGLVRYKMVGASARCR